MDETTVLIEQLQNGDKEARKVLIEKNLGLPVFVKPSNSGSSVGVKKASNLMELKDNKEIHYEIISTRRTQVVLERI